MSLHRVNPRRDENEPQIRKRFAAHGWHTEQVSGKGMPDLLVWPSGTQGMGWRICLLVDVKMPKGTLKPAQYEKWKALSEKGIPVYVVRTEADVDALVRGELEPWRPDKPAKLRFIENVKHQRGMGHAVEPLARMTPQERRKVERGMSVPDRGAKRTKACGCLRSLGRCDHDGTAIKHLAGDFDSHARERIAMKAAREAEETFAPAPVCNWGHSDCCLEHSGERP